MGGMGARTGKGGPPYFSSEQVSRMANISPRQLGYWVKTKLLTPEKRGKEWRFTFTDLVMATTIGYLLDKGVSLQKVRRSVNYMRENLKIDEPLKARLVTDGTTIFKIYRDEKQFLRAIDTLEFAGQEVFLLPIGKFIEETQKKIAIEKAA